MDTTDRRFSPEARLRHARTLVWPVLPLAAAAWWVVGALPWIVDGLGSSSPRYWVADAVTGEASGGYITLLPFRTVFLPLLLSLTLVGGAAAGLTTRWVRPGRGRRRVTASLAAGAGALAAIAYTVAQSAGATRQLGSDFDRDERTLVGVIVVAAASGLLGLLLGLCLAHGRPGVAALAAAPVAVALAAWCSRLVVVGLGAADAASVVPWTSAAVVGVVVGVTLARLQGAPARRVGAGVAVAALVTTCQAALAAVEHLSATLRTGAGLPGALRGLAADARSVFLEALSPAQQSWWWLAVAVGVGLAGAPVARRVRGADAAAVPAPSVARDGDERGSERGTVDSAVDSAVDSTSA